MRDLEQLHHIVTIDRWLATVDVLQHIQHDLEPSYNVSKE